MKRLKLIFSTLLLFSLIGCSSSNTEKEYSVGVDPDFFPLELKNQTINLFAFTNELLQEISHIKGIKLKRVNASWDNLLEGLRLQKYDAAITSASPNLINKKRYNFSHRYLKTGPVLIVPIGDAKESLKTLAGHVIAIAKNEKEIELMSKYPKVEYEYYDRIPNVMAAVAKGTYHGCLVPVIVANAFVKDLYSQTLTIASEPLTDEGLRLTTCKDGSSEILEIFDSGVKELKELGKYDELVKKWFIQFH